jgi:hypothetical protein
MNTDISEAQAMTDAANLMDHTLQLAASIYVQLVNQYHPHDKATAEKLANNSIDDARVFYVEWEKFERAERARG